MKKPEKSDILSSKRQDENRARRRMTGKQRTRVRVFAEQPERSGQNNTGWKK